MRHYFVHCGVEQRSAVQAMANIIYTPVLVDGFVIVETDDPEKIRSVDGVTNVQPADTLRLLT